MEPVAERIVLSFTPDEDSWSDVDTDWILDELRDDSYQQYLRRVHDGPVSVGEEWTEFVSCGCATPQDVVLRVERVEGGTELGQETALAVSPRHAADAGPK
ncbi:MAG: hypothetical protein ABEH86_10825 [Haloarcula sp.]